MGTGNDPDGEYGGQNSGVTSGQTTTNSYATSNMLSSYTALHSGYSSLSSSARAALADVAISIADTVIGIGTIGRGYNIGIFGDPPDIGPDPNQCN